MSLAKSPRQYMGVRAILPPDLQTASRNPTASDTQYVMGTLWLNKTSHTAWMFSGSGGWIELGSSGTGDIISLTGDSGGAITPVSGNINILGDSTDGVSVVGTAGTLTINIAAASTTQRGTLETATTAEAIAGSSSIVAVAPDGLQAKIGTQTAHGVALGNTGATSALSWSSAGTAGQAFISGGASADGAYGTLGVVGGGTGLTTLTAHALYVGNGTSAPTALAVGSTGQTLMGSTGADPGWTDSPSFSGSVTAGTSLTATAGDITATLGNVVANGAAKQFQCHGGAVTDFIGTATLTNGTVTVLNTNIATTDRIMVTRSAKNGSTAYGTFEVVKSAATNFVITSCKSDTTTETGDQSTVDYVIVRQV